MLSCVKPAWKKILPSCLGWLSFPSGGKVYQEKPRMTLWGWSWQRGRSCHNTPVFLGS